MPTVSYGNGDIDAGLLLGDESRGEGWWQSKHQPIDIRGGEPFVGSTVSFGSQRWNVVAKNAFLGTLDITPVPSSSLSAAVEMAAQQKQTVPQRACSDAHMKKTGTYKSDSCQKDCLSVTGHPRRNLICYPCERLVHTEEDIRKRLTARAATMAMGGFHANTRSDYLPYGPLLQRTRSLASKHEAERLMRMRAMSKLAASRVRAQRAEDRLKELCDAGNLSAVVRDLHACYDSGAFDDNEAALNFIKDLVQYANNRNDDGSGGTGTRYSESTKRIFGLIDKLGGPKTHFALQANAGGTSLSAVKRHWRKSRTDFEPGIHAAAFIATAEVLRPYIAKLKSEGGLQDDERLLAEISIDETGIIAKGTYREATDEYIGFCGRHDDVNHKCSAVAVKLGDDAGTQARIDDWSENGKAANYGSLFLFNPVVKTPPPRGCIQADLQHGHCQGRGR